MRRDRLPDRRSSETFDVEHNGQRFAASVGRYDDGRSSEVLITGSK